MACSIILAWSLALQTAANLTRMMQLIYKRLRWHSITMERIANILWTIAHLLVVPTNLVCLGQIWQYRLKCSKAVRSLLEVLEAGLPTSIGSDSFYELEVRTNKLQENCSCLDIWGIDWIVVQTQHVSGFSIVDSTSMYPYCTGGRAIIARATARCC